MHVEDEVQLVKLDEILWHDGHEIEGIPEIVVWYGLHIRERTWRKSDGQFGTRSSFNSLQIFDIHVWVSEWRDFKSTRASAISSDVNWRSVRFASLLNKSSSGSTDESLSSLSINKFLSLSS